MRTIPQPEAEKQPFNLQIRIPDPLKRELKSTAAEQGRYLRDVAVEVIECGLQVKRQEAKKLRDAEATKANGKKR